MERLSFLGQGWAFPPAFIKGSGTVVVMSREAENIQENLQVLFSTEIGERMLEFDYGTNLKQLAFAKVDAVLIGRIKDSLSRAILGHERRIQLEDLIVDTSQSTAGLIRITVKYIIIQTNDRANFVYPFHITEGTNLK